ncbi:ABC-2 transporter permease [Chloroflexota bacterium]
MRWLSLCRKALLENLRDWKILILTLAFGPFFVVLMYLYFGETTQSPYRVMVVNHDEGATRADQGVFEAGRDLMAEMTSARNAEGVRILEVEQESELAVAQERLAGDDVDLIVEIPLGLSRALLQHSRGDRPPPVVVKTYGNPANVNYLMAAVWSDMITYEYAVAMTGTKIPLELEAITISGGVSLNEFDFYVPSLLTLGLIMLMFTAAATLIKEKDTGTLVRLRLSNMTTFEWFSAVSVIQVAIGLGTLVLTLLTAVALGYRSSGSIFAVMVVGLLSSLSIVAISLLVAAFLRTIFDLLTIGCFPFFILMFFSGGMFPLPPLRLFTVGSRSISINDLLPTTHTISALDKILNSQAGLSDVLLELAAIAVLTIVFFAAGTWFFTRRHMRAGAR